LFNTKTNFFNVIYALFLREIQTRFGTKKMGYFWAIVEPSVQIAVFLVLKVLVFHTSMAGVDFAVFLASGFIAYNLFKNIVTHSMGAFESNQALFLYAQVKPIHTIFARVLVEFLVFIFVSLFFLTIGWYFHSEIVPFDLIGVMLAVIFFMVFAFSLGLLFAVIGSFYETLKKIINLIFTPIMFLSALMYTVDSLPPTAREYILYNPIVHFVELIHGSYIEALHTDYVDFEYMFLWTIIPLFLGLYFYIKAERKIQST
jgi:capsular polysaccharide transport system permease protein